MQVTSLFDKGTIQLGASFSIATTITSSDQVFLAPFTQRQLLIISGSGPNPVGSLEVTLKYKVGGAAAVALEDNRLVWTAWSDPTAPWGPLKNHAMVKLATGGKLTIPAAVAVNPFLFGILFDVPVYIPDTVAVDQLAFNIKNNGTVTTNFQGVLISDQQRH